MPGCNQAQVYGSLEACPGKKSLAGIRRRLYYIEKSAVAAFPSLPDITGTNSQEMKDLAVLLGEFTLAADKYFKHIDLKDEASNVTFEGVGENGSKLFNNQANAIVTGMGDEVKGFCRQALNDDLIYVYQNRDGKFCVIGNEAFTCHTTPTGDTGTEPTGAITTTLAIQCYDEAPVPTFKGKLYTAEKTYIDCEDGQEKTDP